MDLREYGCDRDDSSVQTEVVDGQGKISVLQRVADVARNLQFLRLLILSSAILVPAACGEIARVTEEADDAAGVLLITKSLGEVGEYFKSGEGTQLRSITVGEVFGGTDGVKKKFEAAIVQVEKASGLIDKLLAMGFRIHPQVTNLVTAKLSASESSANGLIGSVTNSIAEFAGGEWVAKALSKTQGGVGVIAHPEKGSIASYLVPEAVQKAAGATEAAIDLMSVIQRFIARVQVLRGKIAQMEGDSLDALSNNRIISHLLAREMPDISERVERMSGLAGMESSVAADVVGFSEAMSGAYPFVVENIQKEFKILGLYRKPANGVMDAELADAFGNQQRLIQLVGGTSPVRVACDEVVVDQDEYGVLEDGDRGKYVAQLQRLLKSMGLYGGNIDGDYGQMTVAAVGRYFARSRQASEFRIQADEKEAYFEMFEAYLSGHPEKFACFEDAPVDAFRSECAQAIKDGVLPVRLDDARWTNETYLQLEAMAGKLVTRTDRETVTCTGRMPYELIIMGAASFGLKPGDPQKYVAMAQKLLLKRGFYKGPVDGQFGGGTVSAMAKVRDLLNEVDEELEERESLKRPY